MHDYFSNITEAFFLIYSIQSNNAYDGVRRLSGLRREPVVSVEKPTLITTSH